MLKYIYIYSLVFRVPTLPPQWYGPPGSTPFPSICKLLAAFLRSGLVFAWFLQRFWLPASHVLGTCYLLDDLRSTHTPAKYLRAIDSHIYIYICAMYLLPKYIFIYIHIVDTYIYIFIHTYLHTHIYIYIYIFVLKYTYTYTYIYTNKYIHSHIYICIYIYICTHT